MSYVFFNPKTYIDAAKFMGSYAGAQASVALYAGEANAATSIYNQMGYYPLQNTDTGEIIVKKLADNAIKQGGYYDQNANAVISFGTKSGGFDVSQLSRNMSAQEIANLAGGEINTTI